MIKLNRKINFESNEQNSWSTNSQLPSYLNELYGMERNGGISVTASVKITGT